MCTHALTFLPSCIIGAWRLNDAKPFLPHEQFYGMLPAEANTQCHTLFPTFMGKAQTLTHPPAPSLPATARPPAQVIHPDTSLQEP